VRQQVPSLTLYRVRERNEALKLSVLDILLVTGRTHQIRRHGMHGFDLWSHVRRPLVAV